MEESHRWEELVMEIWKEKEVVEMAVLEGDLEVVDQGDRGDQEDQVAQEDHLMILTIGVQITTHIVTRQMDG